MGSLLAMILIYLAGLLTNEVLKKYFDDPLKELVNRFRSASRRLYAARVLGQPTLSDDLYFAVQGQKTDIQLIEGDGSLTFKKDRVFVTLDDAPLDVPDDIAECIKAAATNGPVPETQGYFPWNGDVVSLLNYRLGRTADENHMTLDMTVTRTDYFSFYRHRRTSG